MHTLTVDFGNGVRAGTGTNVRILDYDGLVSLPTKGKVVEHAMLDGGYVASVRSETRRLTFDLDFGETLGWGEVARLFPSGATFAITVTRDGVVRRIDAVRDSELLPLGGRGVADSVAFQVPLVCPDPYLKGVESETGSAGLTGLEYPFFYEDEITYEDLDLTGDAQIYTVDNAGDYPVGFVLDYFVSQPGDLTIDVAGQVMVIADLAMGERLRMDTSNQTITVGGENAFDRIASGEFARLPKGSSSVVLFGVLGIATITFTPLYEGV